jgi:hypothetical protein
MHGKDPLLTHAVNVYNNAANANNLVARAVRSGNKKAIDAAIRANNKLRNMSRANFRVRAAAAGRNRSLLEQKKQKIRNIITSHPYLKKHKGHMNFQRWANNKSISNILNAHNDSLIKKFRISKILSENASINKLSFKRWANNARFRNDESNTNIKNRYKDQKNKPLLNI